ncbi:hypothetical protein [Nocardioides sp. Leaf285]|nr:hypothetical protein [Nocardioides sp. Leaf285]
MGPSRTAARHPSPGALVKILVVLVVIAAIAFAVLYLLPRMRR